MAGEAEVIVAIIDIFTGSGGNDDDIKRAVRDINASLVSLNDNLHNSIVAETDVTEQLIRDLFQRTVDLINSSEGLTAADVAIFEQSILNQVSESSRIITDDIQRSDAKVINEITAALIDAGTSVSNVIRNTTSPIFANTNTTLDSIADLDLSFNLNLRSVNQEVSTILDVLTNSIRVQVDNQIVIPSGVFATILQSAESIVASVLSNNNSIFDAIAATARDIIAPQLEMANIIDLEGVDELRLIRLGLDEGREFGQVFTGKIIRDGVDGVGADVIQSVISGIGEKFPGIGKEAEKVFEEMLAGNKSIDQIFVDCGINIKDFTKAPDKLGWLFQWVITLFSFLILPLNMGQVKANKDIQGFRRCEPDALLTPGDSAHMWHVREWSGIRAVENLRKQGFTQNDANDLLNNSFIFPPMEVVIGMWLRGIASDEGMRFAMRQHGWEDSWIDALEEFAFFIPPVQDLITMSVREVFDPVIAAEFGQFEEFPPIFAQWTKKQGVTEEWAKNYWAAHWRLPSENMGFEMLHRDIIDDKKLRSLMKALDIMPGWRDDLIKLSFNPVTRVDIRRIAGMGLISREQTVDRYRFIGYSPADAELMTQFTEEFNASDDLFEFDIASDLTRSQILRFYKKGIVDREATLALLLQAGINVGAAALFLLTTDLEIEERDRSLEIEVVTEKYKFGQINKAMAIDLLKALGLEPIELELALLDLDKIERQLTKTPTKADLGKFLIADIINEEEYKDQLVMKGFDIVWAERYLLLLRAGEVSNDE